MQHRVRWPDQSWVVTRGRLGGHVFAAASCAAGPWAAAASCEISSISLADSSRGAGALLRSAGWPPPASESLKCTRLVRSVRDAWLDLSAAALHRPTLRSARPRLFSS